MFTGCRGNARLGLKINQIWKGSNQHGKNFNYRTVHAVGPDILSKAGHQVVYADRDMDVIRREIVDADAVFVRIIELPQSLLETGKKPENSQQARRGCG